jgi:hypothetical protein
MHNLELIGTVERRLIGWAPVAMLAGLLLRAAAGYLLTHNRWVLDSQIIGAALLAAALYTCATLAGGFAGRTLAQTAATACWIAGLSFLPHRLGWATGSAGLWPFIAAAALLAAAYLHRELRYRRWMRLLGGHGYAWILEWAVDRPFYARLAAERTLKHLGYGRSQSSQED